MSAVQDLACSSYFVSTQSKVPIQSKFPKFTAEYSIPCVKARYLNQLSRHRTSLHRTEGCFYPDTIQLEKQWVPQSAGDLLITNNHQMPVLTCHRVREKASENTESDCHVVMCSLGISVMGPITKPELHCNCAFLRAQFRNATHMGRTPMKSPPA